MLEYGWYPLLLFATTPWFLQRLGAAQYGLWMMLATTVGFGGILSGGTGAATIWGVSNNIGRAGYRDAGGVIRASLAIALIGGSLLSVIIFSIFWFAGATLFARMGSYDLVRQTGLAAALLVWIEQLDNVFSSALKGAEQFSLAARAELVAKTAQIVAGALVLRWFPALWALYATLLIVALLRLFAKMTLVNRNFALSHLRPSWSGSLGILQFAKWGWLQGVGGVLFGVADRFFVGSLLGAASLAHYSIASQLATQIHAISAAGVSVIFPRVTRKLSSNDETDVRKLVKSAMAATLLLSGAIALILVYFGHAILIIWVGVESGTAAAYILPWLIAAYFILALNVVPYYLLLGMGRIRYVGMVVLAAGATSILTICITITDLGVLGAAAGRGAYGLFSLALAFPVLQYIRKNCSVMRKKMLPNVEEIM